MPLNVSGSCHIVVTTSVLFALSACIKSEPVAKVEPPRPVLTVVVVAGGDGETLNLPAETRARVETRYGFRIGSKVSQRLVAVGDAVAAGQLLAKLDPQDLTPIIAAQNAQLEGAKTELKLAQLDLNRTKELREKNFVSQAQLDRQIAVTDGAQARVLAAQAQLKQAQNNVEFQALRADKAGLVTAIEAEVGQVVAAGQAVVRVAQAGPRDIVVNVPEVNLVRAKATPQWVAIIPAIGAAPLAAQLREISPLADPASRTYLMKLTVMGAISDTNKTITSDNLPLGLTAIVRPAVQGATLAASGGYSLPLSALYSKNGQPNVWLVDAQSSTVSLTPVKTAGFTDDAVKIAAGVKAGDRVVVAGANMLVAGQKVKVQ